MSHRLYRVVLAVTMAAALAAPRVFAQGLTGQISGVVTDSSGGLLPGATVVVKNIGTNVTREATTGADGAFVITNLLAGTFDLSVTVSGFRPYEQKGIVLGATERLALRAIALEVGGISEVVSVAAESVKVQTTSGERSATITAEPDRRHRPARPRLHGHASRRCPASSTRRRATRQAGARSAACRSTARRSFNFSYDGVTNKDTGSNSGNYAAPALDSIAEVKVQASNFQAEYGRSSGATITVVTKSGTRDFRGTAAYYKRNENFNTNTWDRRRALRYGRRGGHVASTVPSCAKAPYRFDNTAWTIGGPVLLPGTDFNRNRDKLFFFFSQDLLPRNDPGTLQLSTMPTALERAGDFSQTRQQPAGSSASSGIRCSSRRVWRATSTPAGPGCFPDNMHPGQSHQPDRPADARPVPAAERDRPERAAASTTTRIRTSSRSRGTTRSRAST